MAASDDLDEHQRLRVENARLIGLLESNGIAWRPAEPSPKLITTSALATNEKVVLFRRLFKRWQTA